MTISKIGEHSPEYFIDKLSGENTNIRKFIGNISVKDELSLQNGIREKNTAIIEKFIKDYADVEFNEDGDSEPIMPEAWEIREMALNSSFAVALTNTSEKAKQIVKARLLTGLNVKQCKSFVCEYGMFCKQHKEAGAIIKNYIEQVPDVIPVKEFLSAVISYTMATDANTFLEYVLYYLDMIIADKEMKSDLTKEYIKTVNKLFNKD